MRILISIITLILTINSFANEGLIDPKGWKLEYSTSNHNIYGQRVSKLGLIAFKAEAIVNADVLKLITVLRDAKGGERWSNNLLHLEYIKEINDLEALVYEIRDFPWPFTDRDAVLKYKATINHKRKSIYVTFNSTTHPDFPKNKEYVRGMLHYGLMEFWPRKSGTRIELTILADPKGVIPLWVVNLFQKNIPAKFIVDLENETKKSKRMPKVGIKNLVEQYLKIYPAQDYQLTASH